MATTNGTYLHTQELADSEQRRRLPAHVVLLTNFIAPHKLPIYTELAKRVSKLTVLLSTSMEPNRRWKPDWENLDVRVLKTITLKQQWRHPVGFSDPLYIHIPWNTIGALKELRPDVVISGELGFRSIFSALYTSTLRRVPLIYWAGLSEHTERGRGWVRHVLRKWLLRRADCVIVNGASGARYFRRMGFDPRRTIHSNHPTLPSAFDRLPITREFPTSHRLLFVGQLIERKGVLPFTKALSRWATANPDRRVEFTLVGSGPLQGALESLKRPANLSLQLLGQCGYEQIAECYANSGIFVFPSFADDWGMAVSEAMTAGLPVLGSVYSQAVEEMCVAVKTGWPFRTDHAAEMEQALDAAMSTSSEQLNKMRALARARVALLTPEAAAENFCRAIQVGIARNRSCEMMIPTNSRRTCNQTLQR